MLGSAVGGLIILTNLRTLLGSSWVDAGGLTRGVAYVVVAAAWVAAVAWSVAEHRKDAALVPASTAAPARSDDDRELDPA